MQQSELVACVERAAGVPTSQAEQILTSVLGALDDALRRGAVLEFDDVTLARPGSRSIRRRPETLKRRSRVPSTRLRVSRRQPNGRAAMSIGSEESAMNQISDTKPRPEEAPPKEDPAAAVPAPGGATEPSPEAHATVAEEAATADEAAAETPEVVGVADAAATADTAEAAAILDEPAKAEPSEAASADLDQPAAITAESAPAAPLGGAPAASAEPQAELGEAMAALVEVPPEPLQANEAAGPPAVQEVALTAAPATASAAPAPAEPASPPPPVVAVPPPPRRPKPAAIEDRSTLRSRTRIYMPPPPRLTFAGLVKRIFTFR